MSWLQTVFASLLGTGVGSAVTATIAEHHASKRERAHSVDALASVRTELLVAANRIISSILTAHMTMQVGHIPVVTDDLTLMYRTHASVIHVQLHAKDVLTVTAAYSFLGVYARGRDIREHSSRFAFTYGLYMSTLNALYNAYELLGGLLASEYKFSVPSEFAVFYLGAKVTDDACEAEIKKLPTPDENSSEEKIAGLKNDMLGIKAFAVSLMKDMRAKGYEPTEITGANLKSMGIS